MIEFSALKLQKAEEDIPAFNDKRYIVGCDPALQDGVLCGYNIFTVYDKYVMRYIIKVKTKTTFDRFVEWILKENSRNQLPIPQRQCSISYKFINRNGTATNPVQVR